MGNKPVVFSVQFSSLLRSFTKLRSDILTWNELVDNVNQFTFKSSHGPVTVAIDWGNTKD